LAKSYFVEDPANQAGPIAKEDAAAGWAVACRPLDFPSYNKTVGFMSPAMRAKLKLNGTNLEERHCWYAAEVGESSARSPRRHDGSSITEVFKRQKEIQRIKRDRSDQSDALTLCTFQPLSIFFWM